MLTFNYFHRNSVRHMRAYAPPTEKKNVKKIEQKFSSLHIDIVRVNIKFYKNKTTFFCDLCEKRQKICHIHNLFYTKIYRFYTRHEKCRFSMEPLCEHAEFRDVPIKLCVQIFQHLKNVFKKIKKIGACAPFLSYFHDFLFYKSAQGRSCICKMEKVSRQAYEINKLI
jgi:hypothetical protein